MSHIECALAPWFSATALALAACTGPAFSSAPSDGGADAVAGTAAGGGATAVVSRAGSDHGGRSPSSPLVLPGSVGGFGTDNSGGRASASGGSAAGSDGGSRTQPTGGGGADSEAGAAGGGGGSGADPTGGAGGGNSGGGAGGGVSLGTPELLFGPASETVARGAITADTVTLRDLCPAGSVLVGVSAQLNQDLVGQLQGVCGVPSVTTGPACEVKVTPGTLLDLEGSAPGSAVSALCPAQQVVTGFDGRSGAALDQLRLYCAPLLIADGALSVGAAKASAPIGGLGGAPFQRTDCPAGAVAVGVNVSVDYWLSSFGLPCQSVALRFAAP